MSLGFQHLKSAFHLLYRSSLHSSFICETCPWLWVLLQEHSPAQSSIWSFSNLPLHIDRCRRRTALSRFPAGAMSHSHPYAVTHPIPTTLSHTHTAAVGLMVQWWRNECWVSLKGHFGSLWAFVCFCMCKLAVSGKLHNEGVDGVCPVPAWWCRAVTGWYKGLHCCQTLSQSVHCLQAKGFKPIN